MDASLDLTIEHSEGCPNTGGVLLNVLVIPGNALWMQISTPASHLGLNSVWKYAQDREHWKHLVETATLQLGACA